MTTSTTGNGPKTRLGTAEEEFELAGDIYAGRGAELYDRLMADDHSELREILRTIRGRESVLELAAGSGRITLPLLRFAKSVTAIDRSQDLLRLLDERAVSYRSQLRILRQDLLTGDWGKGYGGIVIGATSIAMFDAAERQTIFEHGAQATVSGGLFVASLLDCTSTSEDHWSIEPIPGVELSASMNRERTRRVTTLTEWGPGGTVLSRHQGVIHVVSASQLASQLDRSGFSVQEPQLLESSTLGEHWLIVGRRL